MTYFISLLSAMIGGVIVVIYERYVSKRQEKALVMVFAQEFINLFSRCSMYYDQMLRGRISSSTLFEISDSATVTRLAELTGNAKILRAVIDLKTWFFQVIRHADMASAALALGDNAKAAEHQALAIAFFMGDPVDSSGEFDRRRYESYIDSILSILDYLKDLNEPSCVGAVAGQIIHSERQQAIAINDFGKEARKTLVEKSNQLKDLRMTEKSMNMSSVDS